MRRNHEAINKKCELLERLGFEIEHEDSRVSFNGHTFDFSASLVMKFLSCKQLC